MGSEFSGFKKGPACGLRIGKSLSFGQLGKTSIIVWYYIDNLCTVNQIDLLNFYLLFSTYYYYYWFSVFIYIMTDLSNQNW